MYCTSPLLYPYKVQYLGEGVKHHPCTDKDGVVKWIFSHKK